MVEKIVAHRCLKHMYGSSLMLLDLFEASEAYLAFDKAPFQGCVWDSILYFIHFGSHCQGCCLEITLKARHRAIGERLREGMTVREHGQKQEANAYFSWLILDCLGGFGHTWELPTLALIKRQHHSPAHSRKTAGNNTKHRGFSNCLHTCRAV